MASSPITSWQIDGKQWKSVRLIFLGSKITADGDCSHEIKRHFAPWKKSYDKQFSAQAFSWLHAAAAKSLQSCPTLCDLTDGCIGQLYSMWMGLPRSTNTRG